MYESTRANAAVVEVLLPLTLCPAKTLLSTDCESFLLGVAKARTQARLSDVLPEDELHVKKSRSERESVCVCECECVCM